MRIIPQGSTAYLRLEFRNVLGNPEPPLSAIYRIDDLTSGQEVRDDTSFVVPPSGIYVIKLDKDDNDLIDSNSIREHRRVSIKGLYNIDLDQVPGVYDYSIDRVFL